MGARTKTYKRKAKESPFQKNKRAFKAYGNSLSYFTRNPGLTTSLVRKIRYTEFVNFNPTVGAAAVLIFKANGCYDPNFTGIGHQPLGFDQYMAMYEHFRVVSSTCTLTVMPDPTLSATNNFVIVNRLSDSTAAITNSARLIEAGFCSWDTVSPGDSAKRVVKSFDTNKYFPNQKNSFNVVGSQTGDPSELALYHLSVDSVPGTGDPGIQYGFVVIDYIVQFTEPKILTQS